MFQLYCLLRVFRSMKYSFPLYIYFIFLFLALLGCFHSCSSSKSNHTKKRGMHRIDDGYNNISTTEDSISVFDTQAKEFVPKIIFNSHYMNLGKLDTIIVQISKDESYFAIVDRINRNVNNTISVRAKFNEFSSAFLLLSSTNGNTEGVVKIPERNIIFQIKSDILSDIVYLTEVNEENEIEDEIFIHSPEKP